MTNYNELSDFEINKRVAVALDAYSGPPKGIKEFELGDAGAWYDEFGVINDSFIDYCNNPADAWEIIIQNHITLQAYATEYSAYPLSDRDILATNKNPLRAAMIVFLMMEEESGRL